MGWDGIGMMKEGGEWFWCNVVLLKAIDGRAVEGCMVMEVYSVILM